MILFFFCCFIKKLCNIQQSHVLSLKILRKRNINVVGCKFFLNLLIHLFLAFLGPFLSGLLSSINFCFICIIISIIFITRTSHLQKYKKFKLTLEKFRIKKL